MIFTPPAARDRGGSGTGSLAPPPPLLMAPLHPHHRTPPPPPHPSLASTKNARPNSGKKEQRFPTPAAARGGASFLFPSPLRPNCKVRSRAAFLSRQQQEETLAGK